MRVGTLMVVTKIPTGLRFINHDNPSDPKFIDIHEGDYYTKTDDGGLYLRFSAYNELQKRGAI